MMLEEMEVAVMDGTHLVQRWRCRRATMPNGAPGVLWRGVAYPLLSGDRIDVGAAPPEAPAGHHAVLPGDEASWVLVQGMAAVLDTARKALQSKGVVVSRTGRWLGEPVGQIAFDWFLRCEGRVDEPLVTGALGPSAAVSVESGSAARLAVLEQRISSLRADLARAEQGLRRSIDVRRPPLHAAVAPSVVENSAAEDSALQNALAEIQALRAALEAVPPEPSFHARPELQAPQMLRVGDEVTVLLAALRPDIVLLRDSLLVALGEFDARGGFYKALGELPLSGSRPNGWKTLRGAERWWERHVSTGRNDHGRAYARFDTEARQWSLLLGWKVEQSQDIAWLKRQG